METPTYGKGLMEDDQLAAHLEEVEILHLHLDFGHERGVRGRRCWSPAWEGEWDIIECFILVVSKEINQSFDENANQIIWN